MKEQIIAIVKRIAEGFLAGMLISMGGAVFVACYDPAIPYTKYVGAVFFCMALLCICWKGFSLYTGKIGLVLQKHSKEDLSILLLGLLGNFIGTVVMGYLIAYAIPSIKEGAYALCAGKLEQGYLSALIRAVLCGIMVYLAVDIFNNHKSVLGVVFCIPVFILSGYEHSIADMFYFAASGIASWQALGYIWIIIIGNSLGALIIPALRMIGCKKQNEAPMSEEEPQKDDKAA